MVLSVCDAGRVGGETRLSLRPRAHRLLEAKNITLGSTYWLISSTIESSKSNFSDYILAVVSAYYSSEDTNWLLESPTG